jgi:hypothetical protein
VPEPHHSPGTRDRTSRDTARREPAPGTHLPPRPRGPWGDTTGRRARRGATPGSAVRRARRSPGASPQPGARTRLGTRDKASTGTAPATLEAAPHRTHTTGPPPHRTRRPPGHLAADPGAHATSARVTTTSAARRSCGPSPESRRRPTARTPRRRAWPEPSPDRARPASRRDLTARTPSACGPTARAGHPAPRRRPPAWRRPGVPRHLGASAPRRHFTPPHPRHTAPTHAPVARYFAAGRSPRGGGAACAQPRGGCAPKRRSSRETPVTSHLWTGPLLRSTFQETFPGNVSQVPPTVKSRAVPLAARLEESV